MEHTLESLYVLLIFFGIIGFIMIIPLFILVGIEKLTGKNLLVIHLLINILLISSFVKEVFLTTPTMTHGPDPGFLVIYFPPRLT